ncbi:hypothetical protein [Haloarcula pelagica]|uniref:hypothetical protein n=1 Tax=Haloarcula pelagica TaxID=3033389 RepID=UPI0024C32884|nr:hypothetical protein [Halomicroarcula sp. YJ-61-S]
MPPGVFSDGGLSVRITANTRDFEEGMDDAQGEALELAGTLEVVENRADEAEDEIGAAGRSASTASAGFSSLSLSTVALSGSIATLSTTLLPITAALGTAAASAGALAGAFGTVVGSGFVAYADRVGGTEEVFKNLRQEIRPLIVDFGQRFAPAIEDGVDALPTLVERSLEAAGSTQEFNEALQDFGGFAMEAIPAASGAMFDLARDSLPALRQLFRFLQRNGPTALREIRRASDEVGPELMELLDALIDLSPTLLRFGTTVADSVLPPLTSAVRATDDLLESFNNLPPGMQDVIAKGLVLAPLLAKIGGSLTAISQLGNVFAGTGIGAAAGSAATFASAGTIGAAIGLGIVDQLEQRGILEGIEGAGQGTRETVGGQAADTALNAANILTLGQLEATSEAGAGVISLVGGDASPEAASSVFQNAGVSLTPRIQSDAVSQQTRRPPRAAMATTQPTSTTIQVQADTIQASNQREADEAVRRIDRALQREGVMDTGAPGR